MAPHVRLRWTPFNIDPILRHAVPTNEVEEAIAGPYLAESGYGGPTVFIGRSGAGRVLTVIVGAEGAGQYVPVAARPASRKERGRYQQTYGELPP